MQTERIEIFDDKGASHPVRVPVSVLQLLVDVLTEIAEGNAVGIIPIHAELTTQDAADVLNVSRPFLVQCWSAARSRSTRSAHTAASATRT